MRAFGFKELPGGFAGPIHRTRSPSQSGELAVCPVPPGRTNLPQAELSVSVHRGSTSNPALGSGTRGVILQKPRTAHPVCAGFRTNSYNKECGLMNELGGYEFQDLRPGMSATFAKTIT